MAESDTVREIAELIQQGNAAVRAGDLYEARKHFRRATELAPDHPEAWLGMAAAVRPFREKLDYLQRVLALDPSHAEARASLSYVEGKVAEGVLLAPKEDPQEQENGAQDGASPTPTPEVLYCYRHPDHETVLTCTQCGNPICHECVRPAFVGQLCPDCARERRPPNYQVSSSILAIASSLAFVASLAVSFLVLFALGGFLGLFLAFIFAPMVAEFIIRILDRLIRAKRGRAMQIAVGAGMAGGALIPLMMAFFGSGHLPLSLLIFTVVAVSTAVARLR